MNRFRHFAVIFLLALLLSGLHLQVLATETHDPLPGAVPENPVEEGFTLCFSGEAAPGQTLQLYTQPALENAAYFIRWETEEFWTVLESDQYTIPQPLPDCSCLWIRAVWNDTPAVNELKLEFPAESPEESEPTDPPETPSEEPPEETEPEPSPSLPEETEPSEPETPFLPDPELFFGLLHSHSEISGRTGTPEEIFQSASQIPGLDFFALTDYSHCFDMADTARIHEDASAVSARWRSGKAAAAAVTGEGFLGIFGYEMAWEAQAKLGHISTFRTPGFVSRDQEAFSQQSSALEAYYAALAEQPGSVSQFNHPGNHCGTFEDFTYSETADKVISLIEVGTPDGIDIGAYIRALDKGWHLAPTCGQSGRTVIRADALTEDALFAAMKNHRVYATQDGDLEITCAINDYPMGSSLPRRLTADTVRLTAALRDPTDDDAGTVEVITTGGVVLETCTGQANPVFTLPAGYPYYFLRVTQPDGDIAVTAPVWIRQREQLGIRALSCETEVPAQGQPVTLALELYNEESSPFLTESIGVYHGERLLQEESAPASVSPGEERIHRITFPTELIGSATLTVKIRGSLDGIPREYEKALPLFFRRSQDVSDVLIFGSSAAGELSDFGALAAENGIRLAPLEASSGEEMLKKCRLLLVTEPEEPFPEALLSAIREFVEYGGSLAVFGSDQPEKNRELNRLLETVGATARLTEPLAEKGILLSRICREDRWCESISPEQKFFWDAGCAVDPGQGQWLVRTEEETTVLAREETSGGGFILTSGCLFPGNTGMQEPENIWQVPYANRTLGLALLNVCQEPLSAIRIAREAPSGQMLRIRGYVTAGTSNPRTTFPDTIYLQDDTGGIAVIPFSASGIAIGTPLEITGYPDTIDGNPAFRPVSHKILPGRTHCYPAKTGSWATLLDPALHGGELVKVEGVCTDIQFRSNGTIRRITLRSGKSKTVQILIEDAIRSGATGKNTLHKQIRKNHTVRALGLLHTDGDGNPVLRVRNCEEVVYVPPKDEVPRTADGLSPGLWAAAFSLAALFLLTARPRRRA